MSKATDVINKEIDYIEFEIKELQRQMDNDVQRFKNYVESSKFDSHKIALIPSLSLYQNIKSDVEQMNRLTEKKRYLVNLLDHIGASKKSR